MDEQQRIQQLNKENIFLQHIRVIFKSGRFFRIMYVLCELNKRKCELFPSAGVEKQCGFVAATVASFNSPPNTNTKKTKQHVFRTSQFVVFLAKTGQH